MENLIMKLSKRRLILISFMLFSLFSGVRSLIFPLFLQGFGEGYNTTDAIAALNFGLVILLMLKALGGKEKKYQMHYSIKTYLTLTFFVRFYFLSIS